ncbi:MAG: serine threonine kinase, partial [Trebouxia sp. A1-2]
MSAASLQLHTARRTAPRLALGNNTSSDPLRPNRTTQSGQANPQAAAGRGCALKPAAYSEDIDAIEGFFDAASATTAHKPHTPVTRAASDGQKGDHYHYLRLLSPSSAEGGTTVRQARHRDGSLVAIKGLTVQATSSWGQLEMLEQEAAMLRSMSHPGIPSCLSTFQCDVDGSEGFFIVQASAMAVEKLVSGPNLQQMLDAGCRPAEQDVERIASEVLALMVFLQQQQVVHGAIEPEHIMLEGSQANGAVSLSGFSRATKVDGGGTACEPFHADPAVSITTGTESYCCQAPEQLAGEARLASDMYALGSTLLGLLEDAEGLAIAPARLDLGPVSNTSGLNKLLQQLLHPSWQERPSPAQAQHILTQAQHQANQTQSNRAAQSVPADPAKQYASLQDLQAVFAALQEIQGVLQEIQDKHAHKGQQ